jgi:hypothetical protein
MLDGHKELLARLQDVEGLARKLYDKGARPLETVVLRTREMQTVVKQRIASYEAIEKAAKKTRAPKTTEATENAPAEK